MPHIKREDWKHNQKIYEGICLDCQTKFFANKPMAKYCSDLCRSHAYVKRKERGEVVSKNVEPGVKIKYITEKIYFDNKKQLHEKLVELEYKKKFVYDSYQTVKNTIRIGNLFYKIDKLKDNSYSMEPSLEPIKAK